MRAAIYAVEGDAAPRRTGIYTRISRDDDRERLGVQRQEEDCRREAGRRGWDVTGVYEDDDLSGSGKVRRPRYDQLVADIRRGAIDAVIAWDLDRLHRGMSEFVEFYEACEKARIVVAWTGGEADFATGRGLLELELKASFAREELRKIRQRVKRKHLELLEQGVYVGQHRTFGYEWPDGAQQMQIVDAEAELVREAARRVLDGEAIASICRDWARRRIWTLKGKRWSGPSMMRLLVSGRISGRRDYHFAPDGSRLKIPRIETAGDWDGIISPEDSDRLRSLLAGRNRRLGATVRKNLLTGGIARCGVCGSNLQPQRLGKRHSNRGAQVLICRKEVGYEGCGQISVMMQPVDDLVSAAVLAAIEEGALERLLRQQGDGGQQLAEELTAIHERLRQLGRQWAAGDPFAAGAREELVARERKIKAELEERRRALHLEDLPDDLVGSWLTLPLHKQRAVIAALVEAILVHPKGRHGGPRFDPARVDVRWRA